MDCNLEAKALTKFKDVLDVKMSMFDTTSEEDEKILERHENGTEVLPYNHINCVKLRLGEKYVYHFFLKQIDRFLDLLTDQDMTSLQAEKIVDEYEDFQACRHYFDMIIKPLIKKRELIKGGKSSSDEQVRMINWQVANALPLQEIDD